MQVVAFKQTGRPLHACSCVRQLTHCSHIPAPCLNFFPCVVLPTLVCPAQQDITRGRGMVDELFQGWGGMGGTQNAIMSSQDYLSQVKGGGHQGRVC